MPPAIETIEIDNKTELANWRYWFNVRSRNKSRIHRGSTETAYRRPQPWRPTREAFQLEPILDLARIDVDPQQQRTILTVECLVLGREQRLDLRVLSVNSGNVSSSSMMSGGPTMNRLGPPRTMART